MYVDILLDSVNPFTQVRLTTFRLGYPQNIHQQMLTHRMFSRNSSSLRAISHDRLTEFETVYPIWTKEAKGMSGERFNVLGEDLGTVVRADSIVDEMRESIEKGCKELQDLGVHHQNINDYLRPFQEIQVVLTATDFDNFFELRCDYKHAKPEIYYLACWMRSKMAESVPAERYTHIPLVEAGEVDNFTDANLLSAARCARISYLSESDSVQKDLELGAKLWRNKHLSAFEHQATAQDSLNYYANFKSWQSQRNQKGY